MSLIRAKKLYLDTRKIHEPSFDALVKKDPTKHKKYIEWMARVYINGNHCLDQYDIIKDFNDLVEKHRIKGEQADINRYKSPEEVYDVVKHFEDNNMSKTQTSKKIKAEEAEKVFENDKVIIVKPLSKDASIYYGANTRWCTSASSSYNYFNSYFYNRNVTLYYVISKIPVQKNYEKIAVAVYPDGKKEVYLANDEQVHFESIISIFKKLKIPIY